MKPLQETLEKAEQILKLSEEIQNEFLNSFNSLSLKEKVECSLKHTNVLDKFLPKSNWVLSLPREYKEIDFSEYPFFLERHNKIDLHYLLNSDDLKWNLEDDADLNELPSIYKRLEDDGFDNTVDFILKKESFMSIVLCEMLSQGSRSYSGFTYDW